MSSTTASASSAPQAIRGPRGYPLVGVLPMLLRERLPYFTQTAYRYDGIARLPLHGKQSLYLISRPEAVKHILQTNPRNYVKGYDSVADLLGNGLVTSEGSFWLRQRRLMQPVFHQRSLQKLFATMAEIVDAMLDRWDAAAQSQQPLNVAAEMTQLTMQIIVRTMFGTSVGPEAQAVSRAFHEVLDYLGHSQFSPISIPRNVPTPGNRRYNAAMALLDRTVYGFIAERRQQDDQATDDLLGMLVAAQDADTGERMNDKQIRDEVMTIFLAGHETTASLVSWALYLLAQHPAAEQRMRAEHAAVLAGRAPTFAEIGQLTYARMVLDETLRLYPTAWIFGRRAVADDVVCGYHLPANTQITISPYATHRDPAFWENPEAFEPERFTPERAAERPRFAYYPFAGGPRVCIGNNFALMEAQLILAMTFNRFRLSLVPGQPVKARAASTLRPHPGVLMTLRHVPGAATTPQG